MEGPVSRVVACEVDGSPYLASVPRHLLVEPVMMQVRHSGKEHDIELQVNGDQICESAIVTFRIHEAGVVVLEYGI